MDDRKKSFPKSEGSSKLGFLFKKSSLPKSDLNSLLYIEDFVSKINAILDTGKRIEDDDIYNIVKQIYFPMLKDFQTESFKQLYKDKYGTEAYRLWSHKFRIVGQAARRFSKTLYEEDTWIKDYEEFLK